jgi:hypothetical protein
MHSARDGAECSASRPGRFTSAEIAPGTHWIGGWVGPRANLDAERTCRESNPGRRGRSLVTIVIQLLFYMGVKRGLLLWWKINYNCVETNSSRKYLDRRRIQVRE